MKKTVPDLFAMKHHTPMVMLTAYDYAGAAQAEAAGVDMVLVGDSLGMVVLGYDSTLPVTVDDMIHHAKAVRRGAPNTFMVVDLPFGTFHTGLQDALRHAVRIVQETGADAVKIEGSEPPVLEIVRHLNQTGIPVMGHVGLTPQSAVQLGGFKVQGKTAAQASHIVQGTHALVEAGVFGVVLEAVPAKLAERITAHVPVPTIGIGAGVGCDGQVLVYHDVLGIYQRFTPKFVKRYAELGTLAQDAIGRYVEEVRSQQFPKEEHTFSISEDILERLY